MDSLKVLRDSQSWQFRRSRKKAMEEGEQRDDCGCLECRPQVFTSVLLGILSCVLVTGGVFLAFHKWDHTWLLVSAVGVVLIVIGTILHCCSSSNEEPPPRGSGHKGRPPVIPCGIGDNGTLTEQLLPLSNARSVSQLSLNMVPSYFPAYSIEQHSAVVQNINRIVQGSGKSFLLLPIPSDASPTQLQNLMASVCQLDGNVSAEDSSSSRDPAMTELSSQTTDISASQSTETLQRQTSETPPLDPPACSTQISTPIRIVKHAEVQTCCDWQVQQNSVTSTSNDVVRTVPIGSLATSSDAQIQTPVEEEGREEPVCLSLPDSANIEDTAVAGSTEGTSIEHDTLDVVSEISVPCNNFTELSSPVECCNIPLTTNIDCENTTISITGELIDSSSQTCVPEVVVVTETFEDPALLNVVTVQSPSAVEEPRIEPVMDSPVTTSQTDAATPSTSQSVHNHELLGADLLSATSDQLDSATEVEDSESIGRSSPPPSYDDVTQENQMTIGAFGLAYGTI